jgi:muramoyltetrapeptide carboxypeptidase
MHRPPALTADSALRVIAPASPFDRARFERGKAVLGTRYRLSYAEDLFARQGFLAGSDAQRLRALHAALTEPAIAGIIGARGGYGTTRLLDALEPAQILAAARWLVGFSDLTALHALWARAGVCSIHGPMVASLADAPVHVAEALFHLLEGGLPRPMHGLTCVVPGRATGPLLGGNLTVLTALVGTPHMPNLDGSVLLLEDVTERPYRIDRMLTTLRSSGALRGLRGVVLGQFTDCAPGPDGDTAHDVLVERLASLGIPMVANAPVGHVPENMPVLLGAQVELDAGAGQLGWA